VWQTGELTCPPLIAVLVADWQAQAFQQYR
jgi:hypothetical protein